MKGARRCHFFKNCRRMSTGSLIHRAWDYRKGRDYYLRGGTPLCQEHLRRHTHAELFHDHQVEDLIVLRAKEVKNP